MARQTNNSSSNPRKRTTATATTKVTQASQIKQAQTFHFQLGNFGKGLIIGLIFGLIFSALITWMVNSKDIPTNKQTNATSNLDCNACFAGTSQGLTAKGAKANKPRQFNFYNKNIPSTSATAVVKIKAKAITPIKAAVNRISYLRSKPYSKLVDVESIKAELAISGFSAKILVIKGKFNLQMGPFPNRKMAQKVKKDLGAQSALFTVR